MIQHIRELIAESRKRRVSWDTAIDYWEGSISPDEAERQLDTATDCGGYAELFPCDDGEEVFTLELEE